MSSPPPRHSPCPPSSGGGGTCGGSSGTGAGAAPPRSGSWVAGQVFVLDRVRIEVALEARRRYKYVRPRVLAEAGGWKVLSPNCSRSVDRQGGEIPIAWLLPLAAGQGGAGTAPSAEAHAAPRALAPQAAPASALASAPSSAPPLGPPLWQLHAWNDRARTWEARLAPCPLHLALDRLVQDPNREFWR